MSAIAKLDTELKSESFRRKFEMVRFEDMEAALSRAFRTSVVDKIQALPEHQQIILCALVKLSKSRKSCTVGDLNKSYLEVRKSV